MAKYKFRHDLESVGDALGISAGRQKELIDNISKAIKELSDGGNQKIVPSMMIEIMLTQIEDPVERAWLIYHLGLSKRSSDQPIGITMLPMGST